MAAPNSNPKAGAPLPMLGGGQPKLTSNPSLRMLGSPGPQQPALGLRSPGTAPAPAAGGLKMMPLGSQPPAQPAAPTMPKMPSPLPVNTPAPTLATPPPRPIQKSPSSEAVAVSPVASDPYAPVSSPSPPPSLNSMTPPPSQPEFPAAAPTTNEFMGQLLEPETGFAPIPTSTMSPPPAAATYTPTPAHATFKAAPPKMPQPVPAPAGAPTLPKMPVAPVPVVGKAPPKMPLAGPPKMPPPVSAPVQNVPQAAAGPSPVAASPKAPGGLAMLGGGAPAANPKLQSKPSMMMPLGAPPVQGKLLPLGGAPKAAPSASPAPTAGDGLPMIPSGQPVDNSLSALLADAQALGLMAAETNPEPADGSSSPRPFSMEGTLSPTRSMSPTPVSGAVSPIRGLSPGRERPGDDLGETEIDIKRRQIVTEILESERKYKNYLQVLVDNGINPIKKKKLMNATELKDIFANIEPLVSFHEMFFSELDRVVGRWSKQQTIGDLFLKYSTGFNLYTEYINNFDKSDAALKKMLKKSKDLQKLEQELQNYPGVNRLDFSSFLIMPVQRLPRYLLLLDDLIKRTDMTHPDYNNILSAIRRVREISDHVNLQKGMSDTNQKLFELAKSLSGFPQESLLRPSRQLIDQKDVVIAGTKGIFSVSVVIFNDAYMIISKSAKGLSFIAMLPFKHSKLSRIPLEYAKARLRVAGKPLDLGKYTNWLLLSRSEEEDYFFAVPSEGDAEAWVNQFDSLKSTILSRYFRRLETNFCPAARYSHTLTASYSNKLYMVGGSVKSAASREVWMLDYEQRTWTQLSVSGVPTITEHTASLLGSRLLIFGGVVDGEYSNRLFSFDISTSTWAELSPQGQPPSSRSRHSAVVSGNRLYVFGGNVVDKSGAMAFFNDVHVYDCETNSWSMVVASRASDAPVARAGAAMVIRGTKIFVWGGAQGEVALNDLCIFDLIDNLWIQPKPVGFSPTPRHSVAVSSHDEYMLLFGGEVKGVPLSDLFVLNMDTLIWTKVRVPVQLPPRSRLPSVLFSSAVSETISTQNTSSSELRNTTLLMHGGRTEHPDARSFSDELVSVQLMDKWLMNESTINSQSDKVYQEAINKKKQKDSEVNVKLISYNFAQTSITNATNPFVFIPPARPGVDAWDGSVASISELAPLGRGTVGDVIKGTTSKAGTLAAIKKVSLRTSDEPGLEARRRLAATVENFKRSRHPNLATYFGVVQESEPQLWIVSELCAGSLKDFLSRAGACLNERQLASVAAQALQGLQFLHQSGAVHRWLKASNVLVTERGEIKLCDYAIGDLLQQISSADPAAVVDAHSAWTSSDSDGTPAGDIYSLGITLIELAENMPPFNDLFDSTRYSPEMQDFIRACMAPVAQRPDASMLLRHVFLNHARPDSLKEIGDFVRRHPLNAPTKPAARPSSVAPAPVSGLAAAVVLDDNVFKQPTPATPVPRAVSAPASAAAPAAAAAAAPAHAPPVAQVDMNNIQELIKSMVQAQVADYRQRTDAVIASLQAQVDNIPALVDQKVAEALASRPPVAGAAGGMDPTTTQALVEAHVGQLRQDTEANVMNLFERIQILDAELLNLRNHLAALASSALSDV